MSFSRVKPAGYGVGDKLASTELNQLDIDHANALDKSSAGDILQGAILFGSGASLTLPIAHGIGVAATSGIDLGVSGALSSNVVGGIRLAGGSSDYPSFSPVRSRSLAVPPLIQVLTAGWNVLTSIGAGQSLQGPATNTAILIPLPVMHNGATLDSVTVSIVVTNAHTGVPQNMPGIGVSAVNLLTGVITTIGSTSIPVPASGAAWHNGGAQQSFALGMNTPRPVIDNTQNIYILGLADEFGANAVAGNVYSGFILNYTSIADMRFPT